MNTTCEKNIRFNKPYHLIKTLLANKVNHFPPFVTSGVVGYSKAQVTVCHTQSTYQIFVMTTSPGGIFPKNGEGCAARLPKPLPYLYL